MSVPGVRSGAFGEGIAAKVDTFRRSFAEFLTVPTCIIMGFFLLAMGTYILDHAETTWLASTHDYLKSHAFADTRTTADLLGAIASGIITVTSITISLLLLAVQQSAAAMTSQVFDQFLRRWHNQAYFGFFVGLSLYTLVTLATATEPFNPVFGATLALVLTIIALYLLILMLYTTINQMRPVVIIGAIHDHILAARACQLELIRKTRRVSCYRGAASAPVHATRCGYVTRINFDAISAKAEDAHSEIEAVLLVSIGTYVAFQDVIAEVKAGTLEDATKVGDTVLTAIHLEHQRDMTGDPAYGIEQIETMGWTSISTAKSNPAPGLLAIRNLRDVLARWSIEEDEKSAEPSAPIVYQDNVFTQLMDAFETLAVASSESMQHQNFIEVVDTFTVMFNRLPVDQQERAEDLVLRIISALGDHVLTAELNRALSSLIAMLTTAKRTEAAAAVRVAHNKLGLSVGKLNSRSTRTADGS